MAAEGTQTLQGMAQIVIILLAACSEINMYVFSFNGEKRLVESLISSLAPHKLAVWDVRELFKER